MNFFNYIFYRIAQLRFKKDGNTGGTAVTLISILQTFLLEFIIEPVFLYFIPKATLASHSTQLGWLAGVIFIVLLVLNYRKYDGKYISYQASWKNEQQGERCFKGWLIIICFVLPIIAIIWANHLLHNST